MVIVTWELHNSVPRSRARQIELEIELSFYEATVHLAISTKVGVISLLAPHFVMPKP